MRRVNYRGLFLAFLIIFITILVFTAIDYYVHTLSPEYAVPGYYFTNKIIFGTIIAFVAYYFVRKNGPSSAENSSRGNFRDIFSFS